MSTVKISGLSGNEIFCMHLVGFEPKGLLVGNSVQSIGILGGLSSAFRGAVGGEIPAVTEMIHNGREAAFQRMTAEAKNEGIDGIVGVTSALRTLSGNSEFLFTGSGVVTKSAQPLFSSSGDAQELYCHIDAGFQPLQFVFGNIAYSVGAAKGVLGALKTMIRGEIKEFSDIFNATRHHALDRLINQAKSVGANSVVGIRTNVMRFSGAHEMYMTGTATIHEGLPAECLINPVSSDLTGEELWAMTKLGYSPVKLLISTAVYSLGTIGGIKAALKSFAKGEISDLTSLIYDAREHAFDRLKRDAEAVGANEVIGIKTYIIALSQSLVEIVAIGTAVQKQANFKTKTDQLPAQAIIRDKDTWVSVNEGLELQALRAGGQDNNTQFQF